MSSQLNDSIYPFSKELPGVIYRVLTPTAFNHFLTTLAINSDLLSLLIYSGAPLRINRSVSRSSADSRFSRFSTSIARHCNEEFNVRNLE